MSRTQTTRAPVELLCEEFLDRWRNGESPTIEQYVAAAASQELRKEIELVFPAMLALEGVKLSSSTSASRPIQLHVDRLEQLGDYRIIREIGRGGMAIVYEAEQQSLGRRVAVKVFPQQAFGDTKHLLRFQREAKTVGCLHHTNIVPVFGIGEQQGLHYFVMQLLQGVSLECVIEDLRAFTERESRYRDPLHQIVGRRMDRQPLETSRTSETVHQRRAKTELGDLGDSNAFLPVEAGRPHDATPGVAHAPNSKQLNNPLPTAVPHDFGYWRQIADLGRQVADGLAYAHAQGVLHRDIKPSNLVIDANWRVWITDFGLAIGLAHDRLSQTGDLIGTLRYMAPEQIRGSCDVRSDVYSLGLTLYELIALRPAFDAPNRGALTQQVLNATPKALRSYCPDVPPDLETIVLKAISREQDARYQSATELAIDLQRFCNDRPILARRMGRIERVRRWSRRNPTLAAMSAALTLCIAVSLATVTVNWRRAAAEGRRAENNLVLALESMDRFLQKFEADWMSHPIAPDSEEPELEPNMRFVVSDQSAAVLQEALLFYDQFAEQNSTNPKLQYDTAKAYQRAGDIQDRLGQYGEAKTAYRKCVTILDSLAVDGTANTLLETSRAAAHNRLAMASHARYRYSDALYELEQASRILVNQLLQDEGSQACRYELALTHSNLGTVLWRLRNRAGSAERHRSAIQLLEQLVSEQPEHAMYRLSLARAYRNYYPFVAFGKQRSSYSKEIQSAAENLLSDLVVDFPKVPDYRCELSEMLTMTASVGDCAIDLKVKRATRAVDLAEELVREFEIIPRYKSALAEALSNKADLLEESSLEEAAELHARSVSYYEELCEQFPSVFHYLSFNARALKNQAQCFEALAQIEAARDAYQQAIALQVRYTESRSESNFGRKWAADYMRDLAELEESVDNFEAAEALLEQANSYWKFKSRR